MRRPTREDLDQAIIETAALLFARHGYSHTSVQQIADAVGYSKTGLLHRFPSKEALRAAVAAHLVSELQALVTAVRGRPVGAPRDLAVLEALADLALRRRGTTSLMVSALTSYENPDELAWMHGVADGLFGAFGAPPGDHALGDLPRRVRILGALGASGVTALAIEEGQGPQLRDVLVATAFDALGYRE